jgi:SAM-dependent methyltransferase
MNATRDDAWSGAAIYTRWLLQFYDLFVFRFNSPVLWKCSVGRLLSHYNRYVSTNHLDVGVGTGYFLDRCRFPSDRPRVVLFDLNSNSLAHTRRRIARYEPEVYAGNILEGLPKDLAPFDSVGLSFFLHCLPGTMATKAAVFDHLKAVMKPGAVLFGSTIVGQGVKYGRLTDFALKRFNERGVFTNLADDPVTLERELAKRFEEVTVELFGVVAFFSGVVPRAAPA